MTPAAAAAHPPPGPPAGTHAPPFSLRCSLHCAVTLDDYRGKTLVLLFYVADWHPVCTGQLERYRDFAPEFERIGAHVVAISPDSFWSHAAFARAHQLAFPLLSDDSPRGGVARAYGVQQGDGAPPRRGLFVVSASGIITWSAVFPELIDPGIDEVLTAVEKLTPSQAHASDQAR